MSNINLIFLHSNKSIFDLKNNPFKPEVNIQDKQLSGKKKQLNRVWQHTIENLQTTALKSDMIQTMI